MERRIYQLQDETRAKSADQCPDSDRTSQQPARKKHDCPEQNFHISDWNVRKTLSQPAQQGVQRAAAGGPGYRREPAGIEIVPIGPHMVAVPARGRALPGAEQLRARAVYGFKKLR